MNKKDLEHFGKQLNKEKAVLEMELKTLGHTDSKIAGGWEAGPSKMDVDNADENELADKIEDFEESSAILEQLETQLTSVNTALNKIEEGTYGICSTCNEAIEKDRLEANPSADTCLKHMAK